MKTKKTVYYILMYLPLVIVLIALPYLPEEIPAHYGFDSQADRWGNKYEAMLFPIISFLMGYFLPGMAKLATKQEEHGENNKKVTIITGILALALFNALNVYSLYTSSNKVENLSSVSLDTGQLVFGIIGVLMIVTGNIMSKLQIRPQKITDFEQISTISEKELKEVSGQFDTNTLVTALMGAFPETNCFCERLFSDIDFELTRKNTGRIRIETVQDMQNQIVAMINLQAVDKEI